MLTSPASTSASLPSGGSFWNRITKPKPREPERDERSVARSALVTLAYNDMETLHILPRTFDELVHLARDWIKPPPEAVFGLRIPVEYASMQAARLVSGPYIWLGGQDTFEIAIRGVHGLRVEIVSDAPALPDEPPPPPPPPVLDMPATFNLELFPNMNVALDVNIVSEDLDMARMEDGTMVDGSFWGKLEVVHNGDDHHMEFSGTRLNNGEYSNDFMVDQRVLTKLSQVAKPTAAKCHLSILAPEQQYCDVVLTFSEFWRLKIAWPPAEEIKDNDKQVKYFLRVHPGGGLEHFESELACTSLYYEAEPQSGMVNPDEFIAPRNGYAMSFNEFIPHLMNMLDQLGMSLHARTNFVHNNMAAFSVHKHIAYRFLSPAKIAAAIDISVTSDPCVFTRIFLIFRGLTDDEVGNFAGAGEKEAMNANWREVVGWSELSKDNTMFRVLETSVLEVS